MDNRFTSNNYRVVHLVVDMPIRLAREMLEQVPPAGWSLGPVIFVQAEFQIVDRETEQSNELGEASHAAYKQRQRQAVMRRLKLGFEEGRNTPEVREADPREAEGPDTEGKDSDSD